MLSWLKQAGESAKGLVLWVVSPLVAVFIMAAYLLKKNRDLKDEVASSDAAAATSKQKEISDEADKTAKNSLDEFNRLWGAYKSSDKPKA